MRAGIADARHSKFRDHRNGRKNQNGHGGYQYCEHRHLHVEGLDLLAQILRCASYHQAGDEDSQDHEHKRPIQASSYSAKYDFTEHDVDERHHARDRRQGIVHVIDRTAARIGGHGHEQGR